MVAPLQPYDVRLILGSVELQAVLARDPQNNFAPMLTTAYAPPLTPVTTTQEEITYSSIPREQGADLAIENVAGGAGAYYYEPGKYAFGEGVATEGGLVYPGPVPVITTIVPTATVNGYFLASSSAANPTTITTIADHHLLTGDSITIAGHTVSAVNGSHIVTVTSANTFTIPVLGGGANTGLLVLNQLDGVVSAFCRHYDSVQSAEVDYIAAGKSVYKWVIASSLWARTTTSGVAGTTTPSGVGGTAVITDLMSFYSGGARQLLAAFGAANRYRLSTDNGAAWADSTDASGDLKVKFWTVHEQGETAPIVYGAVDPNIVYQVSNPDTGVWDTGTAVGFGDTSTDLFTSMTTAPISGEPLFGKKLGLRSFDSNGDITLALGTVPVSSGIGAENFSQPAHVGGNVYTVINDYDIVEYAQGTITTGFGVSRAGPRIPEMQKAITALAGDGGFQFLYAALAGTEGYVMRGNYQDDQKWHWHGAYIKLGLAIGRMFLSSHPAATDKNLYLTICPTASPYIPYRAMIPRIDLLTDPDARFVQTANIRFGYMQAGQAHVFKLTGRQTLQSVNISASAKWTGSYRTGDTSGFTTLASDWTANGQIITFPAGVYGKRVEFKLTYTGAATTNKSAVETLVTRQYRRPIRLRQGQFTIWAHALTQTEAGAFDVTVGPQAMLALFNSYINDVDLPFFNFEYNQDTAGVDPVRFTAELTNVQMTFIRTATAGIGEGLGHALGFTVTFQELPYSSSDAHAQTYQGSAV